MEEFTFTPKKEPTARQNVAEFSFTPKKEPDFSKLKADEIFSTDGMNTNAPQKMNAVMNSWLNKDSKIYKTAFLIDQTAKSGARSIAEMGKSFGTLFKFVGDNLNALGERDALYDGKQLKFMKSAGNSLNNFADWIQKNADIALSDKSMQLDEQTFSGDFLDNPSFTRATAAVGSALPSLVGMGAMAKVVGAGPAYFVMAGVDSSDIYERAKEKGKTQAEANKYYGLGVAGTAMIDKVLSPLESIMKAAPNGVLKKLSKRFVDGLLEGTAETGQQFWQNSVMKYGIDPTQKLAEGVIEAAIGGFGSGAIASGIYSEAREELKAKGATDEEVDAMTDAIGRQALSDRDGLNDVAMQVLQEGMSQLDKFVQDNFGTPEAQKALRFKEELQAVKNEAFERLTKAGMPEEQAMAASQVEQGIALWGAQEFGLSPLEYMRSNSPQVRAEKFADFQKQFEQARATTQRNPFEILINKAEWNKLEKAANADRGASLIQFLRSKGGVVDAGGDLKSRDAGKQAIGLINNKSGMTLDDAALAAWEQGYLPNSTYNYGRPDINALLDAIDDELRGNKRYSSQMDKMSDNVRLLDAVKQLDEEMYRLGVDYSNMSAAEAEQAYRKAAEEYMRQAQPASEDEEYAKAMADYYANGDNTTAQNTKAEEWDDIPFQTGVEEIDNSDVYNNLPDNLRQAVDFIYNGEPVFDITGKEFPNDGTSLNERVVNYYNKEYDGKVDDTPIGTIFLDNKGVVSSIKHGLGDEKANAFAAVPEVLKQGKLVETQENYEGKPENRYLFVAPVTVADKNGVKQDYFMEVVVREGISDDNGGKKRLYIHEVELKNKLTDVFTERYNTLTPASSKSIISSLINNFKQKTQKNRKNDVYYQSAYVSMKNELEGDYLDADRFAGSGEGNAAHGWGNYALKDRETNKAHYYDWMSEDRVYYDGVLVDSDTDEAIRYAAREFAYAKDVKEAKENIKEALYKAEVDIAEEEKHIKYLGETYGVSEKEINLLQELKDYEDSYYALSVLDKEKANEGEKEIFRQLSENARYQKDRFYMAFDNLDRAKRRMNGYKEALKVDLSKFTKKKTGAQYEVDVPEDEYLLDEDKTFNKQSKIVRDAINKIALSMDRRLNETKLRNLTGDKPSGTNEENWKTYYAKRAWRAGKDFVIEEIHNNHDGDMEQELIKFINDLNIEDISDVRSFDDYTGREIYRELDNYYGSQKAASKMLEKYGIKGIKYDGERDGIGYVIFKGADAPIIQRLLQSTGKGVAKGAYTGSDNVIHLFETADASTFMHETAHWFRRELRRAGTKRSIAMLKKVDAWENAEFDKRYKVELKDGYYVIKDTRGNMVYNKQFNTENEARDYGRNEIFARGFEQFLRTGKAPSNYLKSAFKSFWNWLRTLYRSAKQLNADINDDIETVYGTILGGTDLDFYLNEEPGAALQKKFVDNEERNKYIEENISKAQAMATEPKMFENFVAEKTESKKGKAEFLTKAFVPISTRAKRVSQGLKNKLRAYDYVLPQKINEYNVRIKPFMDKWAKFTQDDMVAFDMALKNDYVTKQLEILEKYDALDDFETVHDLLNYLYEEAQSVGVEMGYRENYFPREVADVDGLMSYLYGPRAISELRRAKEKANYNNMTPEEQVEFVNKFLRGYERKDLTKSLPGNVKERRIDVVTSDMNVFYKNSMQALMTYIERMTNSIESRRFWGMDATHIEDSIGAFVDDMIEKGEIKPEQDKEVENILRARFKARGVSNKFWLYQKNMAYIYTMGGINSAITQIDDISVALYKAGLWNTVQSIFAPKHKGLSREELGLTRIGEEFMEASASSKVVSAVFKATGLDKIDAFGKNVLINATFKKFQKMAKSNEAKLREYLEPIMEQETDATIEAIKNDEVTDNVKLLMFNELADMQPISLSEMPEYYLTSGNGRVLYMLKTFALKRIDIFRNECFDKMRKGEVKSGLQNLFKLSMLMMLCGMGKDAIIDLLFGRKIVMEDSIVNNLLGLFGFSKYQLYRARSDGFTGLVASVAVPPILPMWSDLFKDLYNSLFTKNGKDIEDWEVWKGIPIIGRFYYWWMGGGYAKEQKKKKKLK